MGLVILDLINKTRFDFIPFFSFVHFSKTVLLLISHFFVFTFLVWPVRRSHRSVHKSIVLKSCWNFHIHLCKFIRYVFIIWFVIIINCPVASKMPIFICFTLCRGHSVEYEGNSLKNSSKMRLCELGEYEWVCVICFTQGQAHSRPHSLGSNRLTQVHTNALGPT